MQRRALEEGYHSDEERERQVRARRFCPLDARRTSCRPAASGGERLARWLRCGGMGGEGWRAHHLCAGGVQAAEAEALEALTPEQRAELERQKREAQELQALLQVGRCAGRACAEHPPPRQAMHVGHAVLLSRVCVVACMRACVPQQTWQQQDSWMDYYRERLGAREGYRARCVRLQPVVARV